MQGLLAVVGAWGYARHGECHVEFDAFFRIALFREEQVVGTGQK